MKIPQENSSNFEKTPVGTHAARCLRFIDLGSHEQEYQGESKGKKRLVILTFEIPAERMEDGRPFIISKRYTWSMHEKSTLRKHLEAWRGQKFLPADFGTFDIRNVLGKECMISVVEWENGDRSGTAIDSIGKAVKGMSVPELEGDTVYFTLEPDEFDASVFDSLSDSIKETISKSPEFLAVSGQGNQEAQSGSDYSERNPPPPNGEGDYGAQSAGF